MKTSIFVLCSSFILSQVSYAQKDQDTYAFGMFSIGVNAVFGNQDVIGPFGYVAFNQKRHKIGIAGSAYYPTTVNLSSGFGGPEVNYDQGLQLKGGAALFYRFHLAQWQEFVNVFVENWNEFRKEEVYLNSHFDQNALSLTNKFSIGGNIRFWERMAMNVNLGVAYRRRFAANPVYFENNSDGGIDISKPGQFIFVGSFGYDLSFFKPKSRKSLN